MYPDRLESLGVGAKESRAGLYATLGAAGVVLSILIVVVNLLAG